MAGYGFKDATFTYNSQTLTAYVEDISGIKLNAMRLTVTAQQRACGGGMRLVGQGVVGGRGAVVHCCSNFR